MTVCTQLIQPIVIVPSVAGTLGRRRVELPVHGGRARLAGQWVDARVAGVLACQTVLGHTIIIVSIVAYALIIGSTGICQVSSAWTCGTGYAIIARTTGVLARLALLL